MTTISAFKFDTAGGAEQMFDLIQGLSAQKLITLQDAAIVTWPEGKKKPKIKHLGEMAGAGALGGAFWGLLFGLLFFGPFFGMAIGAAMGGIADHFTNYGIDSDFIKSVQAKVTEGSSALFLMASSAVMGRVSDAVKGSGLEFEIISTNLSKEAEAQLREDFGAE